MATLLAKCLAVQESTRTDYATLLQKFDEERAKGFANDDLNGWPPLAEVWFHKAIEALEKFACESEKMIEERVKDYGVSEVFEREFLPKECRWIRLFIDQFDTLCNPETDLMKMFEYAHGSMMELLLQHSSIDPTYNDSFILRFASESGHITGVELLLRDGRADPAACESIALHKATVKGYTEIVRLLLQDGRAQFSIRHAMEILTHPDVLSVYLKDPRLTTNIVQRLFINAINHNLTNQVRILLRDERIDLYSMDRLITFVTIDVETGYCHNSFDTLELLLYDPRLQNLGIKTFKRILDVLSDKTRDDYAYNRSRALIRHLCENTSIPWTTRMYYKMF